VKESFAKGAVAIEAKIWNTVRIATCVFGAWTIIVGSSINA